MFLCVFSTFHPQPINQLLLYFCRKISGFRNTELKYTLNMYLEYLDTNVCEENPMCDWRYFSCTSKTTKFNYSHPLSHISMIWFLDCKTSSSYISTKLPIRTVDEKIFVFHDEVTEHRHVYSSKILIRWVIKHRIFAPICHVHLSSDLWSLEN